jgi:hypothetical protein
MMLSRQRLALNPQAVEANRAGKISGDQRFHLSARATGATLGLMSMTFFAVIAWWLVFAAETRWMAGPGIIATVIAPLALWALYRIVADLRSGQVVSVTATAIILQEGDHESKFRVRIGGHKVRLPFSLADMLHQHSRLTAYFTRWSWMLVNITPAEDA